MKVELKEEKKIEQIKFPCLMRTHNNRVFLISGISDGGTYKGVCLNDGIYSSYWGTHELEKFNGKVIISNE